MKISVVSPVYKAEKIVSELARLIEVSVKRCTDNYEIILVDDRSPDQSWSSIRKLCLENPKVKGVRFSKNFGQHFALTAGLEAASGDFIVIMDCDLQDDPEYIPDLIGKILEGHDIVLTTKDSRAHSLIKNLTAGVYFKIFNSLVKSQTADSTVGNFSCISKKVRDAFLQHKEVHRHYLMILRMLGFSVAYLPVIHKDRYEGKTSYTVGKLLQHALDGLVSQSLTLLYGSIYLGFSFCMFALLGIFFYTYRYFTSSVLPGYTSLVVLLLLSTGLILMSIGVLGIYVGKIFDQVRGRPLYLVDERINF